MLILALVTGVMAVGRYFAGGLVHRLNPSGVLWGSAIITTLGIYLLSISTGGMVYVAALLFAVGICYFWPTMIGFTAENIPKTGALGMSLVGGAGMFAMTFWNPVIGSWLDNFRFDQLGVDQGLMSGLKEYKEKVANGAVELSSKAFSELSGEAGLEKVVKFEEALAAGNANAEAIELAAGQATLGNLAFFPAALIVLFGALYFYMRK